MELFIHYPIFFTLYALFTCSALGSHHCRLAETTKQSVMTHIDEKKTMPWATIHSIYSTVKTHNNNTGIA